MVRPGGPATPAPALAGPACDARSSRSSPAALARFLPAWQGRRRRSVPARPPLRGTGGAGTAGRGRRPAGRAADPRVGARARRPAGPHPRLPAATARRARARSARWRGSGAGSLGRDDGRIALDPAGSRGAARRSARRRGRAAGGAAPRRHPRAAGRAAAPRSTASCSRAAGGALGARGARCAVGSRLGRARSPTTRSRRSAPCAAASRTAKRRRRRGARPGRLPALGPPEAAGRWSLVAAPASRGADAHRTAPRPALALLERHGVLTREAVAAEGVRGGFAAVYPVLRAMEEAGRIRRGYFVDGLGAAQFALPGARGPAARRCASRGPAPTAASPAGRRRSGEPVRRRAAVAAPRRDDRRPLQRAAGRVRRAGRRRRGALPGARRRSPSRRSRPRTTRPSRSWRRVRWARSSRTVGRESSSSAGSTARRSSVRPPGRAARCRVRRRLSWTRPASVTTGGLSARGRHALPDRDRSPAVPGRPDGAWRPGPAAPAPSRRSTVSSDVRITGVEALGKNLIIRFDNGLEIRTHLRMRRVVASLSPGRALAPAARPSAPRHRGPGSGRGLLRRPGRRAPRAAHGGAPSPRSDGSGRICWLRTSTPRRRPGDSVTRRAPG